MTEIIKCTAVRSDRDNNWVGYIVYIQDVFQEEIRQTCEIPMAVHSVTPSSAADGGVTKVRRFSAGGQALHRWQLSGKLTTIHIVYEMEKPLSVDALTEAIEERLLRRFPRFRGHVSADERHWCVPAAVDPTRYVRRVQLSSASDAASDVDAAMQQHLGAMLGADLPDLCSWEVHLCSFSAAPEACYLLWRIAHTVADGVILTQIMSNVLCEPDPVTASPTTAEAATAATAATAAETAKAATTVAVPETVKATAPTQSVNSSKADVRPADRRTPLLAGVCERLRCFVGGLGFVLALLAWPADVRTAIKLGPYAWAERERRARHAIKTSTQVALTLTLTPTVTVTLTPSRQARRSPRHRSP